MTALDETIKHLSEVQDNEIRRLYLAISTEQKRREELGLTRPYSTLHSDRKDEVVKADVLAMTASQWPLQGMTWRRFMKYHWPWFVSVVILVFGSPFLCFSGLPNWIGFIVSEVLAGLSFYLGFKIVTVYSEQRRFTSA